MGQFVLIENGKFDTLPNNEKISFSIVAMLLFFTVVELFSFLVFLSFDIKKTKRINSGFTRTIQRHPWLNENFEQFYSNFLYDPLNQIRFTPGINTWKHKLTVNKFGLVENAPSKLNDKNYPIKPKDTFRIVVMGGSTVVGATVDLNKDTIPSNLERILNEKLEHTGKNIQVINFGVLGYHTFGTLTRLLSEVVYLSPDLVISFEGYNDMQYTTWEHTRQKLKNPILNWADFSYNYFDQIYQFKKMNIYPTASFPPLMYTKTLFIKLYNAQQRIRWKVTLKKRQSYIENLPINKITKNVLRENPDLEISLENNITAAASFLDRKGIKGLFYLQPHPLQFKNISEEIRSGLIFSFSTGHTEKYKSDSIRLFDLYGGIYQNLALTFKDSNHVRFFDMRKIFENTTNQVYNDVIHYNELGNQLIAERVAADIVAQNWVQ